jgi:ABC-type transport system involved in multi-copper enzyme maturation permease subunit
MAAILILTWLYAAWLALFIILLTLRFYVTGLLQTGQTYRLLVTLSSTFFVFTNLFAALFTKNIVSREAVSATNSISMTYTMVC